ncbi:hypothetical protein P3T23_007138 [Paraburkholderia sp. GAS448]
MPGDISVYSTATVRPVKHGPRAYAHGAANMHNDPVTSQLERREQLERLFARTFRQGEYPLETEFYREVIRRGGAIVSVDTSAANIEAAQEAMTRRGAVDIDELAAGWRRDDPLSRVMESDARSQSPAGMTAANAPYSRSHVGTNLTEDRMPDSMNRNVNTGPVVAGPEARERATPHPAEGGGIAGAGRSFSPDVGTHQSHETATGPRGDPLTGTTPEDEYSSYEDEFRRDYSVVVVLPRALQESPGYCFPFSFPFSS